jgi:acetolactate synthase-1/2/3 large subunit
LEAVADAKRGLFIVGGAFAGGRLAALIGRVATTTGFGVVGGHAFPDALPSEHPQWLGCSTIRGSRALKETLAQADTIVLLDQWLGDRVTQGYLPLGARIVAVTAAPDVGWDEYLSAEILAASPEGALLQLDAGLASQVNGAADRARWVADRRDSLAAERDQILNATTKSTPRGRIPFKAIVEVLDRTLPPDVTLVSDAGSFNDWIMRYLPFRDGRRYLGTLSGSMGFGVPGAIGVQLSGVTKRTVALVGDGGFLMTGLEAATIASLRPPVTIVVFRNDVWGSIALHQDRHFPGQRFGTGLPPVSYAGLAKAMSLPAYTAATEAELHAALQSAFALDGPSLLEVLTDPERPSPSYYEGSARP